VGGKGGSGFEAPSRMLLEILECGGNRALGGMMRNREKGAAILFGTVCAWLLFGEAPKDRNLAVRTWQRPTSPHVGTLHNSNVMCG